jgi:hypothetical protein
MAVSGRTPIAFVSHYRTIIARLQERSLFMEMTEVQKRAKRLGIKIDNFKKADLIRKIQIKEGNPPCYQINGRSCDNKKCCWRKECRVKIPDRLFCLVLGRKASTS